MRRWWKTGTLRRPLPLSTSGAQHVGSMRAVRRRHRRQRRLPRAGDRQAGDAARPARSPAGLRRCRQCRVPIWLLGSGLFGAHLAARRYLCLRSRFGTRFTCACASATGASMPRRINRPCAMIRRAADLAHLPTGGRFLATTASACWLIAARLEAEAARLGSMAPL